MFDQPSPRRTLVAGVLIVILLSLASVALAQSRTVGPAPAGARAGGSISTTRGLPSAGGLASPLPFPAGLPPAVQGNLRGPNDEAPSPVPTPNSGLAPLPGVGLSAGAQAAQQGAVPNTSSMGAAGAGGPTSAAAGPPYNPIEVSAAFSAADLDRDDELSRAEAQLLRLRPGTFEQMDRDGNGRITRFEFQDATGR